ncbi:MAG TPA: DUF5105 domain-containing protein [Clostridiaceae bacterium]|nr:DUF5105 domain-containing protein [Clostridiaceae bacterium]
MRNKVYIFIIILLVLAAATGCGKKAETPEQAVINALTAVKNMDRETAGKYFEFDDLFEGDTVAEDDEFMENEETLKLIFNKLSFKVLSSSKAGNDAATVKVEITNIDMGIIMQEFFPQMFALALSNAFAGENAISDEELNEQMKQIYTDLLKREDNQMKTSTVEVMLYSHENSWKIDANDEFRNAILGGMVAAIEEMEESFNFDGEAGE